VNILAELLQIKDLAAKIDCENFADIKNFLSSHTDIQSKILSGEISYVGDGLTSLELKFVPECFYDFLKAIRED